MKLEFQSLFYWIINSIYSNYSIKVADLFVSILILLDYQFYLLEKQTEIVSYLEGFNPYSTGLSILSHNYNIEYLIIINCFNPYSTGLSILSLKMKNLLITNINVSILILLDYQFYPWVDSTDQKYQDWFQSLFYWIINSIIKKSELRKFWGVVSILILLDYQFYLDDILLTSCFSYSFNPYSTGLSILSIFEKFEEEVRARGFNPYSTGLSILSMKIVHIISLLDGSFNPYSTGLSILSKWIVTVVVLMTW